MAERAVARQAVVGRTVAEVDALDEVAGAQGFRVRRSGDAAGLDQVAVVGVAQGFLEESNVNPILEMTRLIMVQRAFENTAALIRDSESSMGDAIKTLGGG